MYSIFYRIIQKILLKKSIYEDFLDLLDQQNEIEHILEIGCADSIILDKLNKNFKYTGFDIENKFIEKSKKKHFNNPKFKFEKKSIHEINFDKYDSKKTIILCIGIFHHVSDDYIKIFIDKTKKFKVYAIDAVKCKDQTFFTKILLFLDKGKFIRQENEYKSLLDKYNFVLIRNRYLRFNYDHLISIKNLNANDLKKILN